MDNKKEREREELHKTIWKIANDLRGSVDGWDFKQYVLGLLFYRFISENIENYVNENQRKAGKTDFAYRNISDENALLGKEQILQEKGFFILPSELFCNVRKKAKTDPNLNITINNVFNKVESSAKGTASEDDVKGLFADFDVKGDKLGNTVDEKNRKLIKMLTAIEELKLGDYRDSTIDTFGDAYEFLMTMYASNAGKSGGEFFTPQEVGELLAKITLIGKTEINKVYDPACGSGSLLLKFAKALGKENVKQGFYGQECNPTTYNLARINMFLHDINYNNFNIALGDTLINPKHWDEEPFDAIVSNPPYSIKWEGKSNPLLINDERFSPAGILAPESKADLAFTMHILSWLSPKGTAAIVEYPGVLSRPGAEQKIRKYLIDNNYVEAVIQLPNNMFFGTGIATCIIVLKKNKQDSKVLFVDASLEYEKGGNKNKLTSENINNIITIIEERKESNFSILLSNQEISEKNYNISVNYHIKKLDKIKIVNIEDCYSNLKNILVKENEMKDKINPKLFDVVINEAIYFKVGETVNIIKAPKKLNKSDYLEIGEYPIIDQGKNFISAYTDDDSSLIDEECVVFGEHTREIKYIDFAFAQGADGIKILTPKNDIRTKYLYYALKNLRIPSRGYNRHWTILKEMEIPIPSLEEQDKIIEILDVFTDLSHQLDKELFYRKMQYEYYRNKLLTFEEVSHE